MIKIVLSFFISGLIKERGFDLGGLVYGFLCVSQAGRKIDLPSVLYEFCKRGTPPSTTGYEAGGNYTCPVLCG
jgi:hypothetical protein